MANFTLTQTGQQIQDDLDLLDNNQATSGQVLTADGSGGASWANASSGMNNPMTAAGDIIIGGNNGTPTRLGKGTAGQVLTMDSNGNAPTWANAASGGGLQGYTVEFQFESNNVGNIAADSVSCVYIYNGHLSAKAPQNGETINNALFIYHSYSEYPEFSNTTLGGAIEYLSVLSFRDDTNVLTCAATYLVTSNGAVTVGAPEDEEPEPEEE